MEESSKALPDTLVVKSAAAGLMPRTKKVVAHAAAVLAIALKRIVRL